MDAFEQRCLTGTDARPGVEDNGKMKMRHAR